MGFQNIQDFSRGAKEILGDIRKLRKKKRKGNGKPDENELPELESTKRTPQLVRHRFKYTSIRAGVLEGLLLMLM